MKTEKQYPPISKTELESLIPDPGMFDKLEQVRGIRFRSTPGHGYVLASRSITDQMPGYMKCTRFSPLGTYEEDCDWCLPIIPILHLYTRQIQTAAIECFYDWHPQSFRQYFKRYPTDSYIESKNKVNHYA